MKIHWFQHVPFEGLGCIAPWLADNGHAVSCTRLWAGDAFPDIGRVDGLIVMGGPMGVYDEAIYPWLAEEKSFIKQIIAQDKPVLGICLGAQLIAEALGSRVWKNTQREIGFFPLAGDGQWLPAELSAFHWHGDTFGIPDGAAHLASSAACKNQAFIYRERVLALQFHLETTDESLPEIYKHCAGEVVPGSFIRTLEESLAGSSVLADCNRLMFDLLKRLF